MIRNSIDDTIAAVSTPIGEGGICIVRLSGPDALAIADRVFIPRGGKKPSLCGTHSVHYGHIIKHIINNDERRAMSDELIDEVLLTVMRAPKTYTKDDTVEVNCHGGIQAAKKVLEIVLKNGARMAEPGEFTKRAFLNGRIDLAQAEAVLDVIRSKTEGSLKVAIGQLEGGLSRAVNRIREQVIGIAANIEAAIDFPDEDTDIINKKELERIFEAIIKNMEELVDSYGEGAVLREGVLAIICGKPNTGKSSLMNLLLKRDRVIVSPIPGTTRDSVEEMVNLKGIPVRLVDTAGISRAGGVLEKEGIKRSKQYVKMADMALFMLDAAKGFGSEDRAISKLLGGLKKLVILNKIDVGRKLTARAVKKLFPEDTVIEVSVKKRRNIAKLESSIAELIWGGKLSRGEGTVVSNARHKELLDNALNNMVSVRRLLEEDATPEIMAVELKDAIENLGLMVGKSVSDDMLDRIFTQFCIGK